MQLEEKRQLVDQDIQEPGNPTTVARGKRLNVPISHTDHAEPEPNLQMGYVRTYVVINFFADSMQNCLRILQARY